MIIVVVKLKSGEEFLAEQVVNSKYVFKNPTVPVQSGPNEMVLQPWCPMSSNREFTMAVDDLMFPPMEAVSQLRAAYDKQFGAGLVVPPTQVITG